VADLFKRGEFDKNCLPPRGRNLIFCRGRVAFSLLLLKATASIFKDVEISSVGVDMGVMATML
jgi:hypothetical protein